MIDTADQNLFVSRMHGVSYRFTKKDRYTVYLLVPRDDPDFRG